MHGGPAAKNAGRKSPDGLPTRRPAASCCYREQGVGDEILFASCYPDLIASAGDVVIECDQRLVSLFARSFPDAEVRAQTFDLAATARRCTTSTTRSRRAACRSGSGPSLDAFPDRSSFLVADPERVAAWRARLAEIGPGPVRRHVVAQPPEDRRTPARVHPARRVGPDPVRDSRRHLGQPPVRRLRARARATAERTFGVTHAPLGVARPHERLRGDRRADDRASTSWSSPRNAVAMLGGALGVPTVMMGNRWDWSDLGTDTSPWFPTIQLVYRHLGEEWDAVLATAAAVGSRPRNDSRTPSRKRLSTISGRLA